MDTSSAKIELNEVLGNLKAGIAMGGRSCADTSLISNTIKHGSKEGINGV